MEKFFGNKASLRRSFSVFMFGIVRFVVSFRDANFEFISVVDVTG